MPAHGEVSQLGGSPDTMLSFSGFLTTIATARVSEKKMHMPGSLVQGYKGTRASWQPLQIPAIPDGDTSITCYAPNCEVSCSQLC